MATIQKFEELTAWQKARELCKEIYFVSHRFPAVESEDIKSQLLSASGSVMDNIAEGFDRGGRKEFSMFLGISKGSAGEVRSQLYRAFDRNYISRQEFEALYSIADEIGKMINGLIYYLNHSDIKGSRYKVEENSSFELETSDPPDSENTKSLTKYSSQGTENSKQGTGDWKPETEISKQETGNPGPMTGNWKLETGN